MTYSEDNNSGGWQDEGREECVQGSEEVIGMDGEKGTGGSDRRWR